MTQITWNTPYAQPCVVMIYHHFNIVNTKVCWVWLYYKDYDIQFSWTTIAQLIWCVLSMK